MYHFKLEGNINSIEDNVANRIIESLTDQWEEDATDFGELWEGF